MGNNLDALNSTLEREPNNIKAIKQRAKVKYDLQDYKGALEDLNRANMLNPNNASTLRYRGATKRMLNDFEGALEDLNRADELQPNNAFVLKIRGATRLKLGHYTEALNDLNRASIMDPSNAFILQTQGAVKLMTGDFKGSLDDLNRAAALDPNDPFTLRNRGATKWMLGNYREALEDLNRANNLQKDKSFTLRYRGAAKLLLYDFQGALEDLNQADQLELNNIFTLRHRAQAWYYLGDLANALEDVTQVLNQMPDDKECLKWKRKIEKKLIRTNKSSAHQVPEGVIQVPFSELIVIQTLGEGGFGEVLLAEWRGIKVALKKIKSTVIADDVAHEAKSLMLFRYKFIVTMMGITTDPVTKNTILIMEYMKHGSLEDLLFKHNVKLTRSEVIRLALDIAQGVNYLHSQSPKVLHRDLKSANVLLYRNKTRAKIADFGTTKFLHQSVQAKTVIGNPCIAMPPEMLAEESYDEKVDVFAFGVILYEMLTNKRLPQLEETHRQKCISDNVTDVELRDLVLECCASDPTKRPHAHHVIKLLRKMKDEALQSKIKDM